MQSSTFAVKDNAAFRTRNFSSNFYNGSATVTGIRFAAKSIATGSLYSSASKEMGAKLARAENAIQSVFGSSLVKARSVRAHASSGGDAEEALPLTSQGKSSGTVLPFVGVACLGAILFGYHLGVVNGALEYHAKDLGIAENIVLQGWIVSALLAGATVGSFTGGTLADKFGRTRTFQLDAIPLAIGAFLCATAQSVQTMIVGRLLAGIGIGISSAIVPLYISEVEDNVWYCSALVGASNVFGTAVASSLMDKMGRKSLLLTSFGGMIINLTVILSHITKISTGIGLTYICDIVLKRVCRCCCFPCPSHGRLLQHILELLPLLELFYMSCHSHLVLAQYQLFFYQRYLHHELEQKLWLFLSACTGFQTL